MMRHPLDKPIWSALTSRQAHFAQGGARVKRFPADVSPFIAIDGAGAEADAVALIEEEDGASFMEVAPPIPPEGVELWSAPGVQMTLDALTPPPHPLPSDAEVRPLGEADAAEMYDLAMLTRPGPFRANTWRMGRFIGLRRKGRLIAMCGERLALDGFTELTALCTHPDHRGAGLGEMLLRRVTERLVEEGVMPFLHAYKSNVRAIAMYQRMGFVHRADVVHAVWRKPKD